MQISLSDLTRLEALGASFSTVKVLAFIRENGKAKPSVIAQATGLSERSVYAAFRILQNFSDLDLRSNLSSNDKRTVQKTSEAQAQTPHEIADPLERELVELGITLADARDVVSKTDRAVVVRQIAFFRFRVANPHCWTLNKRTNKVEAPGAGYLLMTIRNPYPNPPKGYHGNETPKRVERVFVAPRPQKVETVVDVVVEASNESKAQACEKAIADLVKTWKAAGLKVAQRCAAYQGIAWPDVETWAAAS